MSATRSREDDDETHTRSPKRTKLDEVEQPADAQDVVMVDVVAAEEVVESLLPPSHALLNAPAPVYTADGSMQCVMETDVGISEYVGHDIPRIQGIIKQRFTDFLVNEVDLDGNVIHLKSLDRPESTKKPATATAQATPAAPEASEEPQTMASAATISEAIPSESVENDSTSKDLVTPSQDEPATGETQDDGEPWPERFTENLKPFLSEAVIEKVKALYLEGPEPPFVSDSGWGGRQNQGEPGEGSSSVAASEPEPESERSGRGKRGRDRGGRGGRGGRGSRGGRGRRPGQREDTRRVLSDPISSKETRTGLHQIVRSLFGGKLETETDTTAPPTDDGSKIVIKWSHSGRGGRGGGRGGRGERGGREDKGERGAYPPYIHFTLQKTNRDTQDALAHLSRSIHCNVKDLSVAGTKDKRGVTVQRVSLRRGNKTVEDVWKLANGLNGRRTPEEVTTRRGERGIRIADFNYRRASLELGMLKGNAFVITLRNVEVDSLDTLERAMNTIKTKGFINYYGMQRFGTAAIPTHTIGLALLKSEWQRAVSLILRVRPGEHPEVTAARQAWLEEGDLDKALELLPRRVVAERCILESFKKQDGDTRNAMGALSTIPRNLRLMYVHAYQSYVWNAIVSERIRVHGAEKPIPGDLVFEGQEDGKGSAPEGDGEVVAEGAEDNMLVEDKAEDNAKADEPSASSKSQKRSRKHWEAPKVKTLTAEDIESGKYTIFDVIMPLPGRDVSFPGGTLGERYKEFLIKDGLDPENFERKQRDYSLAGSYRKILHLPSALSYSVLRYTDPDVPLAQADEDTLLGFDPPKIDEDGKFMALQVRLQLGTAAYATMALREVTKTETSSHFQTGLTLKSEDQKFKGVEGSADAADADGEISETVES